MIPRRNIVAIAVFCAVCALGILTRHLLLHRVSSRYSLLGIILFALALGAFYFFLIHTVQKRSRLLGNFAAIILLVLTIMLTVYRNHYIAYMPRRTIVQVAELIKSERRAHDTIILTFGRGNQLKALVPGGIIRENKVLNNATSRAINSLIERWKYYDIFLVMRNHSHWNEQIQGHDIKLLGSAPDRGGKKVKVYVYRTRNAPEQNSLPSQADQNSILREEWRNLVVIAPAKIANGQLAKRKLPFAGADIKLNFPRDWSFMVINGFWMEGCEGDARVLPATDFYGHNILRLSANKPIRIYSRWIEYRSGDRFQLNFIARGKNSSNASLTIALQDFIAPGAYLPVHEVLHLPLKSGGFKFYTAQFDCTELKGGKKFNLALDLQSGTVEILFIELKKI